MKFHGTLLKPLSDQGDRSGPKVDPAGVTFDPDRDVTIFLDFDYEHPIGTCRITRAPDGSLLVEGTIKGGFAQDKLAIGVAADKYDVEPTVLTASDLVSIGLTARHIDPTQPPIEIDEAER